MILQNLIFPKQNICEEKEMYYHVKSGNVSLEGGLFLEKGASVDFLTYFNSFSAGKWLEYTCVNEVEVMVKFKGKCHISLCRVMINEDGLVKESVCEMTREQEEYEEIIMSFSCDGLGWVYYIELKALGQTQIEGGAYLTKGIIHPRRVNIAIGICTFKREQYIKKTLKTLEKYILDNSDNDLYRHIHVFVSDNGQTLSKEELCSDKIDILYNKNLGGAGGFGRCMLEAVRLQEQYKFTNILFMDDDIVLEPETIFRTFSFLSLLKKNFESYILGGGLLRQDIPYIQHVNGERWDCGRIVPLKRGYDLRKDYNVVKNEERETIDYNGWWYCCIPMGENIKNEFPLPIFIHGDDIEYGLRYKQKILTLNGIGVWHDAFDNRKASAMEYYDMRSALICNAIHCEYKIWKIIKMVCKHMVGQMLRYRYNDQLLSIQAVKDFCSGVDFFDSTDALLLNQKIIQLGYKQQDVSERLKELHVEKYYTKPKESELYNDHFFTWKEKLTINGWVLPAKKECIPLPFGTHLGNMYRCKHVLFFDPDKEMGFVVKRNWFQLFVTLGRCIWVIWFLMRNYSKVEKDYKEHGAKLKTKEFWEKYLETK